MWITPEETKKGLECCYSPVEPMMRCEQCPYYGSIVCKMHLHADSLALIQQLQAENAEQAEKIKQLEAERDAAVKDLSECYASHCPYCKNWDKPGRAIVCINCRNGAPRCKQNFEWRGLQEQ